MNLIVLNYHFPPDPSMGGMRWAGMCKYLAQAGVQVHVVASGAADAVERLPDGVVAHRVARRRTLNDVYRDFRESRSTRRAPEPAPVGPAAEPDGRASRRGLITGLREELSWVMAYPDHSRGWLLRAFAATRRLAREYRPTVVVSSGPPHAVHLVGTFIARRHRVPHVVDFRDPWATHRYDTRIWWETIYARAVGRITLPYLERLVFKRAHTVVANTCRLRDLLRSHYPETRVEWIPNGVDPERIPAPQAGTRFPALSLAYAGSLYGGRGLDEIMKAFAAFLDKHPDARAAGSRIRVAGNIEPGHAGAFAAQRRRFGLDDAVEHVGVLSREQAIELARASSLSLVLAQAQELQVPGKVYELAMLGRAVLVITEKNSASADEAERLGLRWVEPTDHEGLVRILEAVWAEGDDQARDPRASVSYESISADMLDLLRRVAASAGTGVAQKAAQEPATSPSQE